jgi:hypothetical protein
VIRRKPRRDSVVHLVPAMFARDGYQCVAPLLGGTSMDCWGKLGPEHVKADPRMGVRAEPRLDRLVTLCEGHREPGMRAGYVWCTDKRNREAMRTYLLSFDPEVQVDPYPASLL